MNKYLAILLLAFAATIQARVQPEEGLWDSPTSNGRGVTIEFQNGVLVATYFGYRETGEAQWWQGVGFENEENTYSGNFNAFENGQCFGCEFNFPNVDTAQDIGGFTITFTQSHVAELVWAGGTETIYKNRYGYGQPLDFAIGAWSLNGFLVDPAEDYGATVNNVVFRMDSIIEIEGEKYALGNYSGFLGTDTYPVLAKYIGEYNFPDGRTVPTGSLISFLYQANLSGTSFMRYDLITNEDKAEGVMIVFDSNTTPPPAGGSYNGFLRAAGAKLIDRYEKEALFPITLNKSHKEYETIKHMATLFSEPSAKFIKQD